MRQGSILTIGAPTMPPMGKIDPQTNGTGELAGFAARMNEICTDMALPEGRGRQTELAAICGVTSKAARRWLVGEGYPETKLAVGLAKWAGVNFDWLMTGRGPKAGDKLPTRALVIDEVMRHGTAEERRELVNFIKYKIENATTPIAREEKARYIAALDTYVAEKQKSPRN